MDWTALTLNWQLEQKVDGEWQLVTTDGVAGFRTNYNKFIIRPDMLEPRGKYRLRVDVQAGGNTLVTKRYRFRMSKAFRKGYIETKPDTDITTRTELKIFFRGFRGRREFSVFCEEIGFPLTRQYLTPSNSNGLRKRFKGIYLQASASHDCGYLFTDKNNWQTEHYF